MKKSAALAVIAVLAAGVMTGCAGAQRNGDTSAQMTGQMEAVKETTTQTAEADEIRNEERTAVQQTVQNESTETEQKEAALQTALKDAGVSEADASRIRVTMDRDDGMIVYEVQFDVNQTEYDYEILADNGQIISADIERWDDESRGGQNLMADAAVAVGSDEAAETALAKVPGASERDIRIELDYDDGRYKYEGNIIYSGTEYEFEIDADSGKILEWSEERG